MSGNSKPSTNVKHDLMKSQKLLLSLNFPQTLIHFIDTSPVLTKCKYIPRSGAQILVANSYSLQMIFSKIQLFDVFTKFRNNAPLFISVSIHSTSNFVEKQREKVIILKCISALYKLNCHLILDITRVSCGNWKEFVCNVQMAWRYLHFSRIDIKMQFSLKSILFVLFYCSRNKRESNVLLLS